MTIQVVGDRVWDWPSFAIQEGDTADIRIGWTNNGQSYELPDGTVSFTHVPIAAGSGKALTHTGATVESDELNLDGFSVTGVAGVRWGVLRIVDENDARQSLHCIVDVVRDPLGTTTAAVSLQDIRMQLFDRLASENIVIPEGQEFTDRILAEGLHMALQLWNDSGGCQCTFDASNFPNRPILTAGAAGCVLRNYRMLLARLGISAQGQISPEKERLQAYAAMGAELYNQYLVFVAESQRYADHNAGWAVI